MAPNDIITADMIDAAIGWCRMQEGLTLRSLGAEKSWWCVWAAECAVKRGDYKAAERFAKASDDTGKTRRWCADVAAYRGDYKAAERFAEASDDPGLARRWCAVAAAYRGHYNLAEWFAKASYDPGKTRRYCAYAAARRGDHGVAERFRERNRGKKTMAWRPEHRAD